MAVRPGGTARKHRAAAHQPDAPRSNQQRCRFCLPLSQKLGSATGALGLLGARSRWTSARFSGGSTSLHCSAASSAPQRPRRASGGPVGPGSALCHSDVAGLRHPSVVQHGLSEKLVQRRVPEARSLLPSRGSISTPFRMTGRGVSRLQTCNTPCPLATGSSVSGADRRSSQPYTRGSPTGTAPDPAGQSCESSSVHRSPKSKSPRQPSRSAGAPSTTLKSTRSSSAIREMVAAAQIDEEEQWSESLGRSEAPRVLHGSLPVIR